MRSLATPVIGAALLLGACGASAVTPPPAPGTPAASAAPAMSSAAPTASPTASTASTASPTATPLAAAPAPVCANRQPPPWVAGASDPMDGVPDPAGRIYFSQFTRQSDVLGQIVAPLYAVDPDGSDLVQLLDCDMERPRVSPDGRRLAFSIVMDDGSWQVAVSAVDGSDLRVLTSTPGYAETPDWSPDGSWLVFSHAPRACKTTDWSNCIFLEGDRYSLTRMDADGSHQRRIGDPDTIDWEPRLSPDGTRVVFGRFDLGRDLRETIVIRDIATGAERTVTKGDRELEHPDWSPDGRWIIYNPTGCQTCEQVERVPADDLDAEPEVLYPADATRAGVKPVYAPDGSRIAFGCAPHGLCLMDPEGGNVVILVDTPWISLNHFDWGPTPPTGE